MKASFKFNLAALLLLACVGVFAVGCGGGSDNNGESTGQAQAEIQEQKDVAKEQVRMQAQREIKEQNEVAADQRAQAQQKANQEASEASADEIQEQAEVAATQNAPRAKTSCGSGVQAGPNTSCSFAENVASKFKATGKTTLRVYSPTTGETYTMSCGPWADKGTACKGGNDASVFISAS